MTTGASASSGNAEADPPTAASAAPAEGSHSDQFDVPESADALALDLFETPGHLIRRAQQIAVSMFVDSVGRDVTPVQYAVLRMLQERPGIDQVTLAAAVALDTSTTAELAARLEAKGWIVRELLPRRQRRLLLTPAGEAVLSRMVAGVRQMNHRMLERLDADERVTFMRLLQKLVDQNNQASRAPLGGRAES